jgi:ATP-binding cassette subfamily B protein
MAGTGTCAAERDGAAALHRKVEPKTGSGPKAKPLPSALLASGNVALTYMRAFAEAGRDRPYIAAAIASGVIGAQIGLLLPLPVKIVVDSAIGGKPLPWLLGQWLPGVSGEEALLVAVSLALGFAVLQSGWGLLDWLYREWLSERITLAFRSRLFRHGLGLPLSADENGSSDAVHRISQDASAIVWTTLYGVMPLVSALASLVSILGVTTFIAPKFAVIVLATSIPMILLIHARQTTLREKWHRVGEEDSRSVGIIREALAAQHVVTTFVQEDREQKRYTGAGLNLLRARLAACGQEGVLSLFFGLSVAIGSTLILYLGAQDVRSGLISVGDLMLVLGYAGMLYGPLQQIGGHAASQQKALVSAERAFALLDRKQAVSECSGAIPLVRASGDIAFEGVSYSYGDGQLALSNVTFEILRGSRVGILGKTGSGKSTLLNLITRQLDPACGRITLDGIDLCHYKLADLRNQFAVLSQDAVLFATTVADNIAYGRPDASLAEIVAATRRAQAHEFVSRLPEGYATKLGERGQTLSGGERQRIALARAFLKNAPILVLDEPTSAIDVETEAEIWRALDELMEGRTTFIVTHRLSALQNTNVVFAVAGGEVRLITPHCTIS